jgi:heat shock protein HslJ
MKALPLLVLVLAVGAVACDEDTLGPTPITNVTWKLETVTRVGSATITVPNPDQFTVRFESNNNMAVRADCNSCSGRYSLDGTSVSIGSLACTLIACPTPGVDQLFTAGLENARTATVSGNQMVMTGPDYTLRFRN